MLFKTIVRSTALAVSLVESNQGLRLLFKEYALHTCVKLSDNMMTYFAAEMFFKLCAPKEVATRALPETLAGIGIVDHVLSGGSFLQGENDKVKVVSRERNMGDVVI